MKGLFIVFCIIVCGLQLTFAQLKVYPAPRYIDQKPAKQQLLSARKKATLDTLSLPFWDDFSVSYGMYPDTLKWIDSYAIWINNGMAINQPTINVATFDGLDSAGRAYNPNDVFVVGYTDALTSRPIDLSETGLPVAERESVYLSFSYQWQGNGEAPDDEDYLQLEFKDAEGGWAPAITISPQADFDRTQFYDAIVNVGEEYFHNHFQFRFRSYGRNSGPYDTWNIDYVYLNANRNANDFGFSDRAIASPLSSLFQKYYAIPYEHFKTSKALQPVTFEATNLDITFSVVEYDAIATFINYTHSGDEPLRETYSIPLASGQGIAGGSGFMDAKGRVLATLPSLPNPDDSQQFNPIADSVDVTIKVELNSNDVNSTFFVNDTISTRYRLSNYYAYDDGSAEFTVGLVEAGNMAAYQFDMLTPYDTLVGFEIYFPPYGITSNQSVSFNIYHDDNGKPGAIWETISARLISNPSLNKFHLIQFTPSILINEPKFYIGWRQPTSGRALVGLDVNTNTADKIFVNTNGFWYQNQAFDGSLMIRPVFGKGVIQENYVGVEDEINLAVYPNPNPGRFYIEGYYDDLNIISMTGATIDFSTEKTDDKTYIQLNKPSGLYLLKVTKGTTTKTYKIVIAP